MATDVQPGLNYGTVTSCRQQLTRTNMMVELDTNDCCITQHLLRLEQHLPCLEQGAFTGLVKGLHAARVK